MIICLIMTAIHEGFVRVANARATTSQSLPGRGLCPGSGIFLRLDESLSVEGHSLVSEQDGWIRPEAAYEASRIVSALLTLSERVKSDVFAVWTEES